MRKNDDLFTLIFVLSTCNDIIAYLYLIEVEEVIRVQEESQFYVSPVKYGRGFLP